MNALTGATLQAISQKRPGVAILADFFNGIGQVQPLQPHNKPRNISFEKRVSR
jgi:hypothetical protein